MYEQFFGFRERPFDLTPNPRFVVLTESHREALSNLEYGIPGFLSPCSIQSTLRRGHSLFIVDFQSSGVKLNASATGLTVTLQYVAGR